MKVMNCFVKAGGIFENCWIGFVGEKRKERERQMRWGYLRDGCDLLPVKKSSDDNNNDRVTECGRRAVTIATTKECGRRAAAVTVCEASSSREEVS
jgi:hypothetical protein